LHVFEHQFPGQVRGIPWLASALRRIKDLDDWFEAELVAKQIEACFGLVITGGPESLTPMEMAAANANEEVDNKRIEKLAPGMVQYLDEGESASTIDPQRPGGTFVPFVERATRSIAASLSIPYEVISKDYFRTTFSSGQLAMLDGRTSFKLRRQTMIDAFLTPFWGRFVDSVMFESEADGTLDLTSYVGDKQRYIDHTWISPGWGFLNPRDEIKALTDAVTANITNLNSIYAEKGEDFETQIMVRRDELMRLAEVDVDVRAYRQELEKAAGIEPEQQPGDVAPDDGTSSQTEQDKAAEAQP
jgi:lambda family phage portal protein